jgi:hypothetical protein
LKVIYAGVASEELPAISIDVIQGTAKEARDLARRDPRAGFFLLWATLEAVVRRMEPDRSGPPQSPDGVVELLAVEGHIGPSRADELRRTATSRNRLAHGDLELRPTSTQIDSLANLVEELAAAEKLRDATQA